LAAAEAAEGRAAAAEECKIELTLALARVDDRPAEAGARGAGTLSSVASLRAGAWVAMGVRGRASAARAAQGRAGR
jgi:hypothetical protein